VRGESFPPLAVLGTRNRVEEGVNLCNEQNTTDVTLTAHTTEIKRNSPAMFPNPAISISTLDSGEPMAPVSKETCVGSRPAATPTVWTHSRSISTALAL
jgi:hypothetical protein